MKTVEWKQDDTETPETSDGLWTLSFNNLIDNVSKIQIFHYYYPVKVLLRSDTSNILYTVVSLNTDVYNVQVSSAYDCWLNLSVDVMSTGVTVGNGKKSKNLLQILEFLEWCGLLLSLQMQ